MATGSVDQNESVYPTLALTDRIEFARYELYEPTTKSCRKKLTSTIVFSQLFGPILHHGSSLIYAPDLVFYKALTNMTAVMGSMSSFLTPCRALKDNKVKTLIFFALMGGAAFLLKGHSSALKCGIQNSFLGWADYNRTLPWWQRGLSISLMMILRLLVSNVLPFTSPAFAFLITISQHEDEQWMAAFYLLICAAPAGAVVPMLDWIAYWLIGGCFRARKKKKLINPLDQKEFIEIDDFSNHFLATEFFSLLTSHLPFSFWVKPFFMEPAYEAAEKAGKRRPTCAAMSVLAGHFMIWAGPATTMHSRKFVPDWWTSIIIQPLGMTEDVAVVLATWAGSSPSARQHAELALYGFMFAMNVANYATAYDSRRKRELVHLLVAVMTVSLASIRFFGDIWVPFPEATVTTATTMTTTAAAVGHAQCESVHSNVVTMGKTIAWVTVMAVLFRVVALTLVSCLNKLFGKCCLCGLGWREEYASHAGEAHASKVASSNIPLLEDKDSHRPYSVPDRLC